MKCLSISIFTTIQASAGFQFLALLRKLLVCQVCDKQCVCLLVSCVQALRPAVCIFKLLELCQWYCRARVSRRMAGAPATPPLFGRLPSLDSLAERDYIVRKWKAIGLFNDVFDTEGKLPGAEKDIAAMTDALADFGCDFAVHRNRTGDEMIDVIRTVVREERFEGQDAFLCLLWTHGGYAATLCVCVLGVHDIVC